MNERRPDRPQAWLRRAYSDLVIARAALDLPEAALEDVCFHSQQCAEKSLKALLVSLRVRFPRTHVLEHLLDILCREGVDLPAEISEAVRLTDYAVQIRHPGVWQKVTVEEARGSVVLAAQVPA